MGSYAQGNRVSWRPGRHRTMSALNRLADRFRPAANAAGCGLVGVHFSRAKLHLIQLENDAAGETRLRADVSAPFIGSREQLLTSQKAVKSLVRRAWKLGRFRGRRVISTLPLEYVKLVSVSYPAGTPEAEPATIANMMADRIDGNLSDYVIDYVPVRTIIRDGERLCIVIIARREHVIAYLDTLKHAGLRVEALEVAPLAIRRLVEAIGSRSNIENVLAINTTNDVTYLTLISGRRLLANQEVQFGEAQLVDTVSKTLDISPAVAADLLQRNGLSSNSKSNDQYMDDLDVANTLLEIVRPEFIKLVREIERAFLYAASESYGEARKRIYLFGRMARWAGADELLGSLVQTPVARMNADLFPFDVGEYRRGEMDCQHAAEIAVASGLALWGMANDD